MGDFNPYTGETDHHATHGKAEQGELGGSAFQDTHVAHGFSGNPAIGKRFKKQMLDATRRLQKKLRVPAILSHRFYGILQIYAIVQMIPCQASPTDPFRPDFSHKGRFCE